jgi:hypothetical protein
MASKTKRKLSQANSHLYDKFKYGLEYETLVYSPAVIATYNSEYERLKQSTEHIRRHCELSKDTFEAPSKKAASSPYRKFIQESITARAASENAEDMKVRYETYASWVICPYTSEDQHEWIVTHDESVESNPKPPREFIPLYHKLEDLVNNKGALLPAKTEQNIVEHIEIVSPVITREQVTNDYIAKALHIFRGKNNELTYFNNEKTSNHIHLSCGTEFDNPRALYNVYIIWMIIEPLILLSLPYWRRDNTFCRSIYETLNMRFKNNKDRVKKEYHDLINLDLDSTSLFTSVFANVKELKSIMSRYQYTDLPKYPNKPLNNDVLNSDSEISRMLIASVFQNYIGNPNERTQYKNSRSRYSGLNALNTLNKSLKTHTVEVRIKHGSDDPEEIKDFINLLTDLFVVAIELKNNDKYIHLNDTEINTIIDLNEIILQDVDISKTPRAHVDNLVNRVLEIAKKHIMDMHSINSSIAKMFHITKASMQALNLELESTAQPQIGAGGPRKKWVFCYGSNGLKQLRRRVNHKGPWESRPAILEKYALIFSANSKLWKGAIASIWPDDKSKVYGMVVKMNAAEIALLDQYEGTHIEDWYVQDRVYPIDALTKERYTAMAYVNQDIEFEVPPSIAYLKAIEENLKNAGLTPKQIGKAIPINIIDIDKVKLKKVGKWEYDTDKIAYTSKRMTKLFDKK